MLWLPLSLVLAAAIAHRVTRLGPRPWHSAPGALLTITALVLYRVTPRGAIDVPIGLVLGAGIGLTVGSVLTARRGRDTNQGTSSRRPTALAAGASVVAFVLVLWVAANDPTVQWFGTVITHGDRGTNRVALTFDDGPDDEFSLEIAAILDAYDTKGTFFEVGKAIDSRPDIVRRLFDGGHLLANHSYHHDYWRWLDPRYPELERTQDAFERQLGVCPAFFRPPHGQRTPFMLARVSDRDMHTVTWDVSASDWTSTDAQQVADTILDRVQPGSIILLHDGIDGSVDADRTVVVEALPRILDGLEARGLEPVRLDELLGLPGYLDHC